MQKSRLFRVLKYYIWLIRPYSQIQNFFMFWFASVLTQSLEPLKFIYGYLTIALIWTSVGFILNDIVDRNYDKNQIHLKRPIAMGLIKEDFAKNLVFILSVVGILMALSIGGEFLSIILGLIILFTFYNIFGLKHHMIFRAISYLIVNFLIYLAGWSLFAFVKDAPIFLFLYLSSLILPFAMLKMKVENKWEESLLFYAIHIIPSLIFLPLYLSTGFMVNRIIMFSLVIFIMFISAVAYGSKYTFDKLIKELDFYPYFNVVFGFLHLFVTLL